MIFAPVNPTGGAVQDIIKGVVASGGADSLLDDAAKAAGFDGFSTMLSFARRGQSVLRWFTPARVGMIAGATVALTLAVTRVTTPRNAVVVGAASGFGSFLALELKR